MTILNELWNDESGAIMAEYSLLLVLISVSTIAAILPLRNEIIAAIEHATDVLADSRDSSPSGV